LGVANGPNSGHKVPMYGLGTRRNSLGSPERLSSRTDFYKLVVKIRIRISCLDAIQPILHTGNVDFDAGFFARDD
jgi:hypothetical protein